jgi:hypothetical protein
MSTTEEFDIPACSLCGGPVEGWGHNPAPLADREIDGPCCQTCNDTKVIPARLVNMGVPLKVANEVGLVSGEFGMGKTGLVQEPPTDG